jgi:GTP-dependent phosphoenolpyruvate carboxykinase
MFLLHIDNILRSIKRFLDECMAARQLFVCLFCYHKQRTNIRVYILSLVKGYFKDVNELVILYICR